MLVNFQSSPRCRLPGSLLHIHIIQTESYVYYTVPEYCRVRCRIKLHAAAGLSVRQFGTTTVDPVGTVCGIQ